MESDFMNCRGVQKFLYAFADGQLSVKANCEVLDHLKMCPACSHVVDEHQALRASIGRSIAQVQVPREVHARVEAALATSKVSAPGRRAFSWRSLEPGVRRYSMAAGILLLVGGAWIGTSLFRNASRVATPPVVVEGGQIAASLVADIHTSHIGLGRDHQSLKLPNSLADVGPAISRHFNDRLAVVVPDLSAYGYEFESANFCGVKSASCLEGGHIIYASPETQTRLSFFVVPRFDRFDKGYGQNSAEPESYREYEVDQASGTSLAVLAWHRDETTFVCCGPIDIHEMKAMVGAVRTAMTDFEERLKVACSELRRLLPRDAGRHTHRESSCNTPGLTPALRDGFVPSTWHDVDA